MKVRDVMTANVETVQITDSIRQAAERMRRLDVGVMPALDGNDPVGMLTDRDIAIRAVAMGRNPETTRIGEIMTPDVFSCGEDQDIEEAAGIMEEKKIRRLLVRNASGKIIGIVSLGDLAAHIDEKKSGEILREVSETAQPVR